MAFFVKQNMCTCLTDYLNYITKRSAIVILFDMTKAFVRISHCRLLHKIGSYGTANPFLSWMSLYLSSRKQVVQANIFISESRLVTSAVVQGSSPGPLLYLSYVNDVFDVIWNGVPFLYADIIKTVHTFPPKALESTRSNMAQHLTSLSSSATDRMMKFSAKNAASWGSSALHPQENAK